MVVLSLLCLIAFRVSRDSQSALIEGDRLAEARDYRGAIDAWRRSAEMHLPLLPSSEVAIERLLRQAALAESEGRPEEALSAYRAVHAAALSARSFYVPFEAARSDADAAIARLESNEDDEEARLSALAAPSAPTPFFFLANLSFVALVVLTLVFIREANRTSNASMDPSLTPRKKQAYLAGILLLACLTLIGFWQA